VSWFCRDGREKLNFDGSENLHLTLSIRKTLRRLVEAREDGSAAIRLLLRLSSVKDVSPTASGMDLKERICKVYYQFKHYTLT